MFSSNYYSLRINNMWITKEYSLNGYGYHMNSTMYSFEKISCFDSRISESYSIDSTTSQNRDFEIHIRMFYSVYWTNSVSISFFSTVRLGINNGLISKTDFFEISNIFFIIPIISSIEYYWLSDDVAIIEREIHSLFDWCSSYSNHDYWSLFIIGKLFIEEMMSRLIHHYNMIKIWNKDILFVIIWFFTCGYIFGLNFSYSFLDNIGFLIVDEPSSIFLIPKWVYWFPETEWFCSRYNFDVYLALGTECFNLPKLNKHEELNITTFGKSWKSFL